MGQKIKIMITAAVVVFMVVALVFTSKRLNDANRAIIEAQTITQILIMQLDAELHVTDSLNNLVTELSDMRVNPYAVGMEVKQAYYEKVDSLNGLDVHDQLNYLSSWLSENYNLRRRYGNSNH